MTDRRLNPNYATHHDAERAYLTDQRRKVAGVDPAFTYGVAEVEVPQVGLWQEKAGVQSHEQRHSIARHAN